MCKLFCLTISLSASLSQLQEDYQNLVLRCEILAEEESNLHLAMKQCQAKKREERKQIEGIESAEQRLREKIKQIEGQIENLQIHKRDYVSRCQDMDREKDLARSKLDMVKQTKQQLQCDMHRLQQKIEVLKTM